MSINVCTFIGRCVKPPEVREAGGTTIANFSIACNEKYKNKSGEMVEKCEFVNIVFFGKTAEIVGRYVEQGKEVYVSGKFTTEKYTDKQGVEKYATKIIGDKLQLLGGKSESQGAKPQAYEEPVFGDDADSQIPF